MNQENNGPNSRQFYTPAFNTGKSSSTSSSEPCNKSLSLRSPFEANRFSDPSRLFKTPAQTDRFLANGFTSATRQRRQESDIFDTIRAMKLPTFADPDENDENQCSSGTDDITAVEKIQKQLSEEPSFKPHLPSNPTIQSTRPTIDPIQPFIQSASSTPRVFIPCESPSASRHATGSAASSSCNNILKPVPQPTVQPLPQEKPQFRTPISATESRPPPVCSSASTDSNKKPANAAPPPKQVHPRTDLRPVKVNNKTYYLMYLLGSGGSSKVYQVYDPSVQRTCAFKYVDLKSVDASIRAGYENEIDLLVKLKDCERVVHLYDYEKVMNGSIVQKLYIIMEKGDADLSKLFKDAQKRDPLAPNGFKISPHCTKYFWEQMVEAVDEIHQRDVVHADIKPVNFITVSGRLKLIDFGIANAIETDHTSVIKDNQIGTINYMAPEALMARTDVRQPATNRPVIKFNCRADIWSLGCILYTLAYGRTPFHAFATTFAKMQAITDEKYVIEFPPNDDQDLVDCLKKCLQRDPRKRPTARELLEHPYLTRTASATDIDSKKSPASSDPQAQKIYELINSLTPSRLNQVSKFLTSQPK